ncbi:hypothetical protein ACP6L2_03885 [Sphingobacterium lactis]|uniref:hypothetical protein n=1 Tax=Sphingobacterium lactis TaxID=797291 RepID=UPI003F7CF5DC
MKRICETVYFHLNEDGVKRERTINLGLIKYHSTMFDNGEKDRSLRVGSITIEYAPGIFEILSRGKIKIMIRI